jgi:hypothetical protein
MEVLSRTRKTPVSLSACSIVLVSSREMVRKYQLEAQQQTQSPVHHMTQDILVENYFCTSHKFPDSQAKVIDARN